MGVFTYGIVTNIESVPWGQVQWIATAAPCISSVWVAPLAAWASLIRCPGPTDELIRSARVARWTHGWLRSRLDWLPSLAPKKTPKSAMDPGTQKLHVCHIYMPIN